MPRWLKRGFFASLFVAVACNGGGGGCGGCAGVTPLPQGFPIDKRIENAGTARLTQSGLAFLSQNLGTLVTKLGVGGLMNGVLQQPIPPTDQSVNVLVGNVTVKVCDPAPSDPTACNVEVDIGNSMLTL